MDKEETLTPEAFASLLGWLGSDERASAAKYENIRARLITVFVGRGCYEAELLADRTIDRVVEKLPKLNGTYQGDPALYFYGVAKNIYFEWQRERLKTVSMLGEPRSRVVVAADEKKETKKTCLSECLGSLPKSQYALILDYYSGEKKKKVKCRNAIANRLGITAAALQMRIYRLRLSLLKCVKECSAKK